MPPLGVGGGGEQTCQHDVAGLGVGHVGVPALDALKQSQVLSVEHPTFQPGDGGRRGIVLGVGPVDELLGVRHVLVGERGQSGGVDPLGDFQVFKAVLEPEVEAADALNGPPLEVEHVPTPAVVGHQLGGAVDLPQLVPPAHCRGVVGLQMRLGAFHVGLPPHVLGRPGVVIEQEQMLAVGLGHQGFQAAVLGRGDAQRFLMPDQPGLNRSHPLGQLDRIVRAVVHHDQGADALPVLVVEGQCLLEQVVPIFRGDGDTDHAGLPSFW